MSDGVFFRDAPLCRAYIQPVNTTIDTIRDDFAFLDDWEDRYRYIIELGQGLAPTPMRRETTPTRCRDASARYG